mmetsp:Transcript_63746/g.120669  ORF Transcript_63746/g.120669 Transcript_63746/m.120669 type:complete len:205 (-) Transcript_63746:743-1357(-)
MASMPSRLWPNATSTSSTLRSFIFCFFTSSATIIGACSPSCPSVCTKAMLRNFCSASACLSTGMHKACQAAIQSFGVRATPFQSCCSTSFSRSPRRTPSWHTGSSVSSPTSAYRGSLLIFSEVCGLSGGTGAGVAAAVAVTAEAGAAAGVLATAACLTGGAEPGGPFFTGMAGFAATPADFTAPAGRRAAEDCEVDAGTLTPSF